MESVQEKMEDVHILESTIYIEMELVNSLKDFLEWEKSCGLLIEKWEELILNNSRDLDVGPINSLICKRMQLESHLEEQRRRFIHDGRGLKRKALDNPKFFWKEIETAFNKRVVTGAVINIDYIDPQRFLIEAEYMVTEHVKEYLEKYNSIKVNTMFNGEFILKEEKTLKGFHTKNYELYTTSDLHEWYVEQVIGPTMKKLEEFQERGSGWALYRILNLMVNINKFNPFHHGCYQELPADIKNKKAIINIESNDNACFAHTVVAALYPAKSHLNKVCSYPDYKEVLNLEGIEFPVTLKEISKFEELNNISVNVFTDERYVNENCKHMMIVPLHPSKRYQEEEGRHVDLFYIPNSNTANMGHFALIKNLSRLVSSQTNHHHGKKHVCRRCLHYFYSEEKLRAHTEDCSNMNECRIIMPSEKDKWYSFTNHNAKQRSPYAIYADLECILKKNDDDHMIQKHKVYSVAYYLKCDYDKSLCKFRLYRGDDPAAWFVKEMKDITDYLMQVAFSHTVPMEKKSAAEWDAIKKAATHCSICEKPFTADYKCDDDDKCSDKCDNDKCNNKKRDRDHCHFTGKFRGIAHHKCNLNFKKQFVIPIFFHNLSGYDSHFIIEEVVTSMKGKIIVLPITKEKYISFTQYIPVKNKERNMLFKLRFIDSFRFLPSSLDNLSSTLKRSEKKILREQFPNLTDTQFNLLTRKGVFPYEYIDSFDKLNETKLPSKDKFYSSLTGDTISDDDYTHAQNVWKQFNIQNMGEYSDLYLKTDVLLLADIYENFRDNSINSYKLDPAHHFTLPGYTWNAMLNYTGVKLELLTDVDMEMFIERGIRGGITQCVTRYAQANNKYMKTGYNPDKETNNLMYYDANNLYGWAMCQYLPYGEFKWVDDVNSIDILSIEADSDIGYVFEVDLHYPKHLHDLHNDLPFCPTHEKPPGSKQIKLMTTLYDKKRYIIHYRNLQQCIKYGLKLTKVHRILQFAQSPWMKPYIDFNTTKRQQASDPFQKNLYKLMNNAVFGKTMENIRKHVDVKLLTKWEGRCQMEAAIAKPNFHSRSIFSENFAAVQFNKLHIEFNKPMFVGMCILELSKILMYDFHYGYMLPLYGDKLKTVYMDTDSFIYDIQCPDVYEDMKQNIVQFDTSDYKIDNAYDMPRVNKKVLGLMKDENNGEIMTEFVGLRPKVYMCKVNGEERKRVKGIKRNIVTKTIEFDDMKECLFEQKEAKRTQTCIRSRDHKVYTVSETKIALSPFDDKRYIEEDGINTKAWGHYSITDNNVS